MTLFKLFDGLHYDEKIYLFPTTANSLALLACLTTTNLYAMDEADSTPSIRAPARSADIQGAAASYRANHMASIGAALREEMMQKLRAEEESTETFIRTSVEPFPTLYAFTTPEDAQSFMGMMMAHARFSQDTEFLSLLAKNQTLYGDLNSEQRMAFLEAFGPTPLHVRLILDGALAGWPAERLPVEDRIRFVSISTILFDRLSPHRRFEDWPSLAQRVQGNPLLLSRMVEALPSTEQAVTTLTSYLSPYLLNLMEAVEARDESKIAKLQLFMNAAASTHNDNVVILFRNGKLHEQSLEIVAAVFDLANAIPVYRGDELAAYIEVLAEEVPNTELWTTILDRFINDMRDCKKTDCLSVFRSTLNAFKSEHPEHFSAGAEESAGGGAA